MLRPDGHAQAYCACMRTHQVQSMLMFLPRNWAASQRQLCTASHHKSKLRHTCPKHPHWYSAVACKGGRDIVLNRIQRKHPAEINKVMYTIEAGVLLR